jgi:hypothetical protein
VQQRTQPLAEPLGLGAAARREPCVVRAAADEMSCEVGLRFSMAHKQQPQRPPLAACAPLGEQELRVDLLEL